MLFIAAAVRYHGDELIIPYAMSDHASSIAKVSVTELLNKLLNR